MTGWRILIGLFVFFSCAEASFVGPFQALCSGLVLPISPTWKDPGSAKLRLDAVISHQNRLREQKGLPKLATDSFNYSNHGNFGFYVETPGAFPDQPITGDFMVLGDALIRHTYNDIFSLNYVYLFQGVTLVKVKTYGAWYLEQIPGPTVALYRQMSPLEHGLWERKEFAKLGKNWGHGTKVLHFSVSRDFTSAGGARDFPIVKIEVPKDILHEWAEKSELWSGVIDERTMVSEFVIPFDRIGQLFDRGLLQIEK